MFSRSTAALRKQLRFYKVCGWLFQNHLSLDNLALYFILLSRISVYSTKGKKKFPEKLVLNILSQQTGWLPADRNYCPGESSKFWGTSETKSHYHWALVPLVCRVVWRMFFHPFTAVTHCIERKYDSQFNSTVYQFSTTLPSDTQR